jgi:hypothetical protein
MRGIDECWVKYRMSESVKGFDTRTYKTHAIPLLARNPALWAAQTARTARETALGNQFSSPGGAGKLTGRAGTTVEMACL